MVQETKNVERVFAGQTNCVDQGLLEWAVRLLLAKWPQLASPRGLEGRFWVCCSFPCLQRINILGRCGQLSSSLLFHLRRKELPRESSSNQGFTCLCAWEQLSTAWIMQLSSLLSKEGKNITHGGLMSFYGRTKEFRFFHFWFSLAIVWQRGFNESLFN